MTDWIHCNGCFVQPSPSHKFLLTSCGHVFCSQCCDKCTKPVCHVCENKCNVIPLSSKMDPNVEIYFRNPVDIVKKQSQELNKVLEFQNSHRKRLLTKTKERLERAKALYADFRKATTYIQEQEKKNKLLAQELAYLKGQKQNGGTPSTHLSHGKENQGQAVRTSHQNLNLSSGRSTQACKFPSPNPNLIPSNSYPPPPPPLGTRICARTPPSGGRMGVTGFGSNPATPRSSGPSYTPMSLGTPCNRILTPSTPQESPSWSMSNGLPSIGLPNRNRSRFSQAPGSNRSMNGSVSGSQGHARTATVSPYSPHTSSL